MTTCMSAKVTSAQIQKFKKSVSTAVRDRTIGLELEFSNADKERIDLPEGYRFTDNEFSTFLNTDTAKVRNSSRFGGEINTPPIRLRYDDIERLRQVNDMIWQAGGKLNWYIDTHIHLYVADMEIADIRKINHAIYSLQRLLHSVWKVGPWNDTQYAVPLMSKAIHDNVNSATSIDEIARVFKDGSLRGFHRPIVSMAQIDTIGTIEYRMFPGTTSMTSLWEFIKFSYRFVDFAIRASEDDLVAIQTEQQFLETFEIDEANIPEQLYPYLYAADHTDNATNLGEMFKLSAQVLSNVVKAVGQNKVLLHNSFHFDIEQALAKNEIEIYTTNAYVHMMYSIINDDLDFKFPEQFEYLNYKAGASKAEKIARVYVLSEITKKMARGNFYNDRFIANTIEQAESTIRTTAEQCSRLVKNLSEDRPPVKVTYGTFNDMVRAQKDEVVIYRYEEPSAMKSLHEKVRKYFDVDMTRPANDFSEITDFKNYVFVSRNRFLPYKIAYRDERNLVYSDLVGQSIHKIEERKTTILYYEQLPANYEITQESKIRFMRATWQEVDYIRSKYLAKNILLGRALYNYLWFVDDYLIGACMLDYPKRKVGNGGLAWLKSDFVIPSEVPKLSKLLIMAILSQEFKDEVSIRFKENTQRLVTNVFTKHPVSMKYRGVFKLLTREAGKLVYVGETGKFGRLQEEVLRRYLKAVKK